MICAISTRQTWSFLSERGAQAESLVRKSVNSEGSEKMEITVQNAAGAVLTRRAIERETSNVPMSSIGTPYLLLTSNRARIRPDAYSWPPTT